MSWRKCTCRPTRGGKVNPGCGDPDRRTGVIRLSVMARRRGAVCRPSVSRHTRTLAHSWRCCTIGQIFDHEETVMGLRRLPRTTVRECGRAMTRRRGQFADFGIQSHRRLDTSCAGRAVDGQIFDHRETVMGLHWLARTVHESVGERWRDGADCLPTFGIRSHTVLQASWRRRSMVRFSTIRKR